MVASIWSSKSDITLTCRRIIHFNFLLTAAIFASICFCRASGLTFLLSLNFLFTRGYYIFTRVEIVSNSWNFNPGWKSPYNQPFKANGFPCFTLKNRFFQHQYQKQIHNCYFMIGFPWSLYSRAILLWCGEK